MMTMTTKKTSPNGPGSPTKKKGKTKKNPDEDCPLERERIATPTNIKIIPRKTRNP